MSSSFTPAIALLPPCDIRAEQSVLGAMLLTPFATDTALPMLAASDLYRLEHQRIFSAIAALVARGSGVDVVTVASELARERGESDPTIAYLSELMRSSVSRGNVASQARIIQEHATRRRLAQTAQQIASQSYDLETPVDELVSYAESSVMEATVAQRGGDAFVGVPSLISSVFAAMEERGQREGIPGISSGLSDWDAMTLGFRKQKLYIFAGRPGMGKSAAACGILAAAASAGLRVGMFSLEMGNEEIMERLLASAGRVDISDIGKGRLTSVQSKCLDMAARSISSWKIALDDTPGLTLPQIVSRARRMRSEMGGLDLLIVDHITIIRADPARRAGTRAEEVTQIANGLKEATKSFDIPIAAMCQINRSVENRENKRPQQSDIKESGGIEEAADVVTGLYRPCYYQPQDAQPQDGAEPAEWIVLKGRNCRTGVAKVVYHGHYTRFDNAPEEDSYGH